LEQNIIAYVVKKLREEPSKLTQDFDIVKFFSATIPFLICGGIINHYVFYLFFNVRINEFLNPGEVLMLFVDDLLFYVLIYVGIFIFINLLFSFWTDGKNSTVKYRRQFIEYVRLDDPLERLFKFVFSISARWMSILSWVFFGVVSYFEERRVFYVFLIAIGIEIGNTLVRFQATEIQRSLRIRGQLLKEDAPIFTTFSWILTALNLLLIYSVFEARDVKYNYKFINTEIVMDDKIIRSDSNFFFVGKTEDYIFFYDIKKDVSTAYRMDKVKEMHFGKINYPGTKKDEKPIKTPSDTTSWWKFWK
jgi:hypothetical protein